MRKFLIRLIIPTRYRMLLWYTAVERHNAAKVSVEYFCLAERKYGVLSYSEQALYKGSLNQLALWYDLKLLFEPNNLSDDKGAN